MEIDVRPVSGATLVTVKGRVVEGVEADQLRQALRRITQKPSGGTILDLERVTYFDSAGVGILVAHYISLANRGDTIVLLNANQRVSVILELAQLADRFVFATSLEEAIEHVRAGTTDSRSSSA
jgi:anti-anti-sigma factor